MMPHLLTHDNFKATSSSNFTWCHTYWHTRTSQQHQAVTSFVRTAACVQGNFRILVDIHTNRELAQRSAGLPHTLLNDRVWWGVAERLTERGRMYKSLLPFNISLSVLIFADLQQINLAASTPQSELACVCEQRSDHKRSEKQLLVNACVIEFVAIMSSSDASR